MIDRVPRLEGAENNALLRSTTDGVLLGAILGMLAGFGFSAAGKVVDADDDVIDVCVKSIGRDVEAAKEDVNAAANAFCKLA